jgi:hypothetical protein
MNADGTFVHSAYALQMATKGYLQARVYLAATRLTKRAPVLEPFATWTLRDIETDRPATEPP